MWSRQQVIADFQLCTCLSEDTDAQVESVHLRLTRSLISERKYLKHVNFEVDDDCDAVENGDSCDAEDDEESTECSTYLNEETLKGELTSDQQKLANRLSTIVLGDFDLSSDSDTSESGKCQVSKAFACGPNHANERLKKYLDDTASLNGINEETADLSSEEKELNAVWEATDNTALMEAMGLPLSFGRQRHKKSKKNKLSEKDIRKKFTSLWEQHGELMVYKSFVSIYPDYVDFYDEITGSIPPCVEIEITDDSTTDIAQNSAQNNTENDSQNEEAAVDASQIENPADNSHLSEGKGDADSVSGKGDADSVSNDSLSQSHGQYKESKTNADCSNVLISEAGDSKTSENDLSLENDNKESTLILTKSYSYSKPSSNGSNEHNYSANESSFNSDHGYSMSDKTNGSSNDHGDDSSHNYYDENEGYSHEELIALLRGTHEDLKNQIYWYVKEKVSAWYHDHPNQKFKVSSLDEDLLAIAQPYIQQQDCQWEESEEFYVGEDDYNVSREEDNEGQKEEEEVEELVDGSYSGEKINDSLEALGLSVLRDAEKRVSRKRKITHGDVVVVQKQPMALSQLEKLDYGREPHAHGPPGAVAIPRPRHILFDDLDFPVEIKPDPNRTDFNAQELLQSSNADNTTPAEDDSASSLLITVKDSSSNYQRIKKKRNGMDTFHREIFENNPTMKKYWVQRYKLFSKFDSGIRLDKESWYSVTPEPVAAHTAKRLKCQIIVDGFCGAGGNAIQFAMTCEKVIAIDINADKLALARHNAQIYGVLDKIEFVHGDFLQLAESLKADVVFLSPPWGGPSYLSQDVYNIDHMVGFNAASLVGLARTITPNVAFYLPRNSDIEQMAALPGSRGHIEIEQNFLDNKLKLLTAFFGNLIKNV